MATIFLAADWNRGDVIDTVSLTLQQEGHGVVDPRQHEPHETAGLCASPAQLGQAIPWGRPDRELIDGCDALVLIVPAGRDAHADYGFAAGRGVDTIVYMAAPTEAKAVYEWADNVVSTLTELLDEFDAGVIEARTVRP